MSFGLPLGMKRCRLCGFSKPFSLSVSKTRGRSWLDSQTSEAKGTYRERPRKSENQARLESGPGSGPGSGLGSGPGSGLGSGPGSGPGSGLGSIFYKECCFRVGVRVRVSVRLGIGLGWG